jgi:hypothetical protein
LLKNLKKAAAGGKEEFFMKKNIFPAWLAGSVLAALVFGLFLTGCEEAVGSIVNPLLTGTVTITGTAKVGETLTANTGSLGGTGIISYQWIRGDAVTVGTNQASYDLAGIDEGSTIRVRVIRSGNGGSVESAAAGPVAPADLPPLGGTVTVTGTAKVGETLTADISGLEGTGTVSYRWIRGDAVPVGTDQGSYVPVSADAGSTIKVRVTRSGYSGFVESAAAGPVAPADPPPLTGTVTVTGTAKVGQTLTANTGGLGGTGTVSYQWLRGDAVPVGTNQGSYVPVSADAGSTIKVRVTRSGYSGFVESASTGPVAPADPPPLTGTVTITGTAKVGQTLTAKISGLGGTGTVSYQWLRGDAVPVGTNQGSYVPVSADAGSTIKVRVTRSGYSGFVESAAAGPVAPASVSVAGLAAHLASLGANTAGTPHTVVFDASVAIDTADTSAAGVWATINSTVKSAGKYVILDLSACTAAHGASANEIRGNSTPSKNYFNIIQNNARIKGVKLPSSLTGIGERAFSGCTGLTSVTIPAGVTSIGNSAFYECSGLTSVTIPGSVTSIGDHAFDGCTGLTSVTISGGVTGIGAEAFARCTGLTSFDLPASITSIGINPFWGCSGITSFTVAPGNTKYTVENGILYNKTRTRLIVAFPAIGIINGTAVIPSSVTSIEHSAFSGCTGLTGVTIPGSVTSIGDFAFSGCRALTFDGGVTFGSGSNIATQWPDNAFYSPAGNYVGDGLWAIYNTGSKPGRYTYNENTRTWRQW